MADEEKNEVTGPEAEAEETVSAPEGPVDASVEDATPEPEGAAETEEPAAEEPAAEEEPIAEAAEEPSGEVPAGPEADEVAEEVSAGEAKAGEAPAPAAPAQAAPKPKRKRLPRSERHRHVKPKRERPAQPRAIVRLPKPELTRGRRQERRGIVVSSAMDKTIVVEVHTVKAHPKYKKVVRRATKFHAHDEQNTAKVGDLVRIVETRPLSKSKCWRLAEVLEEAR
jgi:small subunit ribosomal protein S17